MKRLIRVLVTYPLNDVPSIVSFLTEKKANSVDYVDTDHVYNSAFNESEFVF